MKVKFSKPIPIDINDIDSFAQQIGCTLPEDLKKYFFEFNGAEPELNVFEVGEKNDSGINNILPISDILEERKYLDHIENSVFPIAIAEGGNYLIVDFAKDSAVYFWDHEEPHIPVLLAEDIYDFLLEKLNPFDPESIELKEGQVTSIWVDPNFKPDFSED